MSNQRIEAIISILSRNKYPSLLDIQEQLEEGEIQGSSERTIKRDIKRLREEHFIEVKYDKSREGYWIDEEASLDLSNTLHLIQKMENLRLVRERFHNNPQDKYKYISMVDDYRSSGSEYVARVLDTIIQRQRIECVYRPYYRKEGEKRVIEPYFIKEWNHTWYVIGRNVAKDQMRTYGLDRCFDLKVTCDTFVRSAGMQPHEMFRYIVGIVTPDLRGDVGGRAGVRRVIRGGVGAGLGGVQGGVQGAKPVPGAIRGEIRKVHLRVTGYFARIIQQKPIHPTQVAEQVDDETVDVLLDIIPTSEFFSELLKMRTHVKVLAPVDVKERYKGILQRMIDEV